MNDEMILLIFGIILFGVGLYALISKRNAIKLLIGIEIMTIAINVVFIAVGTDLAGNQYHVLSRVFPIISLAIGAAVMALGLALVINNFRHTTTIDSDDYATLKR